LPNYTDVNPIWISLLTTFGLTNEQAMCLMPFIGVLDFFVALTILLFPIRLVIIWAVFWTFMTALSRPISGLSVLEFVERASNWSLPIVLLLSQGVPKNIKGLFTIRNK